MRGRSKIHGEITAGLMPTHVYAAAPQLTGAHIVYLARMRNIYGFAVLPAIEAGEVSLIAECHPHEYQQLKTKAPRLLAAFSTVNIHETPAVAMPGLLRAYQARVNPKLVLRPEALRRVVQHLELFRRDTCFPGKGFRFLDWLNQEHGHDETSTLADRAREALDAEAAEHDANEAEATSASPSDDVKQLGLGAAIVSLSYVFWVVGAMEMVAQPRKPKSMVFSVFDEPDEPGSPPAVSVMVGLTAGAPLLPGWSPSLLLSTPLSVVA